MIGHFEAEDNKKLREQIEELTEELNLAHSIAKVANDTLKYTTDELVCPITHELPIDPVIALDGRIYERSAIMEIVIGVVPTLTRTES